LNGNRKSQYPAASLHPSLHVGAQPLQTLVETVSARGTCSLDVPSPLPEPVKAKLIRDLGSVHGVGQILLVGEDKQKSITELILIQHALQLLTRLGHTLTIIGVDDEDNALSVLEVMPPERADLVLASDVPHRE